MVILDTEMYDYQIFTDKEKGTVVAKLSICWEDYPDLVTLEGVSEFVGVAHCKDGDKFDEKVGIRVAKAKARRQFLRIYRQACLDLCKQLRNLADQLENKAVKCEKKIDGITHHIQNTYSK